MKVKEIRKKAMGKLKGHMVNSWVLAFICALFMRFDARYPAAVPKIPLVSVIVKVSIIY